MGGLLGVIEANEGSIAKAIGAVAPMLATVLGSPLAGVGISLLCSKFGGTPQDLSGLVTNINNDPEAELKLRALEYDHQTALAMITDTQDARKYAPIFKDFLRHMTFLVTLGFFAALFLLFLPLQLSAEEKNLLSMLVGMLASKWQTIIDYFFGNSRQTKEI